MVNPASTSSTPSTSPAVQHNSGLITTPTDEGCNDDPPPIPLPPVGHHHGPTGGEEPPASHAQRNSDLNATEAADNNNDNVRVYDYGSPMGKTGQDARILATPEEENAPTLTPSTPSNGSSQSSMTAVSVDGSEVAITIEEGNEPHTQDTATVARGLGVDTEKGLSNEEAKKRLTEEGPNSLSTGGGLKWYSVLGRQVSNSLTLVSLLKRWGERRDVYDG